MTPDQIELVRSSFVTVGEHRDPAARLFYAHLFAARPELRAMFPPDLTEQRRKLMTALAFVVANLERGDVLAPAVEALAVRHVGYGVEPSHYPSVGTALLAMLEEVLGPRFDASARDAWTAAYTLLSGAMIAAATGAQEAPSAVPVMPLG